MEGGGVTSICRAEYFLRELQIELFRRAVPPAGNDRVMGIADAVKKVRGRISASAVKAGRDPAEIRLVAVSKTVEPERIIEAVRAGVTILGENRVQEAREKISEIGAGMSSPHAGGKVEWHLIGHLQKNKARTAVTLFDLIHSVDSVALSVELNRQAEKAGKTQDILVQVKLSGEAAKHGIPENGLPALLEAVMEMNNLRLKGLMTMPPFFTDPEGARPYFRKLKEIAEGLIHRGFPVNELSMGMSNDFEVAIEEGATLVRVGTAIFGQRDYAA